MRRRAVAVACAVGQGLAIVPGMPPERPGWAPGVASAVGFASGLALLRRDRAPLLVLGATSVGYVVQALLRGAVIPLAVSVAVLAVARRAVAEDGSVRRHEVGASLAAVAAVALGPALVDRADQSAPYAVVVLLVALAGVLLAVRAARTATRRRELVQAERVRLARDLHDVVGHGLSAITVQAGAARLAVAAGDDAGATRALAGIEEAGRTVLREVRWMVTLLRDDAERPRLADVRRLVADAGGSGMRADLAVDGDLDRVAADVGEVAYRVVQEALTNVLRHAPNAETTVRVEVGRDVRVEVVDRTTAAVADAAEGNGLRGMRERVGAVGGRLDAGPLADGPGWAVRATLPGGGR